MYKKFPRTLTVLSDQTDASTPHSRPEEPQTAHECNTIQRDLFQETLPGQLLSFCLQSYVVKDVYLGGTNIRFKWVRPGNQIGEWTDVNMLCLNAEVSL